MAISYLDGTPVQNVHIPKSRWSILTVFYLTESYQFTSVITYKYYQDCPK